ncbi:MAG: hypothetical protein ABI360_00130 [Allobranchiibius sp.]
MEENSLPVVALDIRLLALQGLPRGNSFVNACLLSVFSGGIVAVPDRRSGQQAIASR